MAAEPPKRVFLTDGYRPPAAKNLSEGYKGAAAVATKPPTSGSSIKPPSPKK